MRSVADVSRRGGSRPRSKAGSRARLGRQEPLDAAGKGKGRWNEGGKGHSRVHRRRQAVHPVFQGGGDNALERGDGDAALDSDPPSGGRAAAAQGRNATLLAHLHPLPGDAHLTFDEASHAYTVWGAPVERSVTALVASLFGTFDPQRCTAEFFDRWAQDPHSNYYHGIRQARTRGDTDEAAAAAIREGWANLGEEASRLGTALHLHAELTANRVPGPAPHELRMEAEQYAAFLQSSFVRDAGLEPYRTELSVAWRANGRAVTAGQVDCLYRSRDGLFTLVDFKRVASKHSLAPWTPAFRDAYGKPPVEELPDTPFWRYSLQQSLYNVMAKQVRACVRVRWSRLAITGRDERFALHRRMASIARIACTCCGCMPTEMPLSWCNARICGTKRYLSSRSRAPGCAGCPPPSSCLACRRRRWRRRGVKRPTRGRRLGPVPLRGGHRPPTPLNCIMARPPFRRRPPVGTFAGRLVGGSLRMGSRPYVAAALLRRRSAAAGRRAAYQLWRAVGPPTRCARRRGPPGSASRLLMGRGRV